ncbi:hypothetical protein C1645_828571 [Glomus cerebriforme]|uniref:Uncharacterized protein n=1 Tax=Glomus cerebriforme TaxID=658196 RepID=A0A397SL61_9GLOM|nr:hypothetical protein C1645_828571 [Glomus cerebriforme]
MTENIITINEEVSEEIDAYGGSGIFHVVKDCEFFSEIKVSKEQHEYLGVKMCEFASKILDFSIQLFKNTFDANEEFHKKATLW